MIEKLTKIKIACSFEVVIWDYHFSVFGHHLAFYKKNLEKDLTNVIYFSGGVANLLTWWLTMFERFKQCHWIYIKDLEKDLTNLIYLSDRNPNLLTWWTRFEVEAILIKGRVSYKQCGIQIKLKIYLIIEIMANFLKATRTAFLENLRNNRNLINF